MAMSNETIVDRVVARLKAQPLGDLITEEDLHDIVKQAIPQTFFEPRIVKTDSYGRTETKEPLMLEVMRELLKDAAQRAAQAWVKENPKVMMDYWKQVCDEGLLAYVQRLQNEQATTEVRQMLAEWLQKINESLRRRNEWRRTPLVECLSWRHIADIPRKEKP